MNHLLHEGVCCFHLPCLPKNRFVWLLPGIGDLSRQGMPVMSSPIWDEAVLLLGLELSRIHGSPPPRGRQERHLCSALPARSWLSPYLHVLELLEQRTLLAASCRTRGALTKVDSFRWDVESIPCDVALWQTELGPEILGLSSALLSHCLWFCWRSSSLLLFEWLGWANLAPLLVFLSLRMHLAALVPFPGSLVQVLEAEGAPCWGSPGSMLRVLVPDMVGMLVMVKVSAGHWAPCSCLCLWTFVVVWQRYFLTACVAVLSPKAAIDRPKLSTARKDLAAAVEGPSPMLHHTTGRSLLTCHSWFCKLHTSSLDFSAGHSLVLPRLEICSSLAPLWLSWRQKGFCFVVEDLENDVRWAENESSAGVQDVVLSVHAWFATTKIWLSREIFAPFVSKLVVKLLQMQTRKTQMNICWLWDVSPVKKSSAQLNPRWKLGEKLKPKMQRENRKSHQIRTAMSRWRLTPNQGQFRLTEQPAGDQWLADTR